MSYVLLPLLLAGGASGVTMDWTLVGNAGNACDPQVLGCYGAVPYEYYIGTYEVTNAQYTAFLNAVAKADPGELYNPAMFGYSINRTGDPGSYAYTVIAGRGDVPIYAISFFDALRFANWMNNGQSSGAQGPDTTESGAYTLLGETPLPSNWQMVTRNDGAAIFLPTENEWYKAAYYDALSATYFDYPTSSNTPTTCSEPTAAINSANCNYGGSATTGIGPTLRGSYPGSASPYGTFDQGGNLEEFTETIVGGSLRRARGGSYYSFGPEPLSAAYYDSLIAPTEYVVGFRLAAIVPEPDSGLLVIAGLFGLAGWRRAASAAVLANTRTRGSDSRKPCSASD